MSSSRRGERLPLLAGEGSSKESSFGADAVAIGSSSGWTQSRFRRLPWFPVLVDSTATQGDRKEIDVVASFAPRGPAVIPWKAAELLCGAFTLLYGIAKAKCYYFVYATHWGVLFSSLYFLLSLTNSCLGRLLLLLFISWQSLLAGR